MTRLLSRAEWNWLFGAIVVILLFTSLPVIAGHLFEPEDQVFNGAVYDRRDYAVHLATMQRGADGEWTYQFMYSTEQGGEANLKLSYILMGQVAGALGLEVEAAYQVFRLITGAAALVGVYIFMAHGLIPAGLRRTGFLLAATASGIGWLLLIIGWVPDVQVSPIDFWLIDLYVFYSIATFPHFSVMIVLLLSMAIGYLRFVSTRRIGFWILAALSGLIMLPLQPFTVALGDLAAFGAVLGGWRAKRTIQLQDLGPFALLVATQLPLLLYYQSLIATNPVWIEFASQNVVLSPSPIYFLLGVGIVAPFAMWGALIAYRRRAVLGVQAIFWSSGALILSLAPTLIQRRFTLVIMVPLALLAAMGLGYGFLPALRKAWHARIRTRRGFILALVVVLTLPSTLYLSTGGALYASQTPSNMYDPKSVHAAIDWLSEAAAPSEAVLASEETGLLIPAFSGIRTYIGHPIETLHYEEKRDQVQRFFTAGRMTAAERQELLRDCACTWVFIGPYESSDPQLPLPDGLILKYDRNGVRIYQSSDAVASQ